MSKKLRKDAPDAMPFPLRWFDTLLALPDRELREMLQAIGSYRRDRRLPDFSGIAAALWNEFRQRIEFDLEKLAETEARNRENGAKGAKFGHLGGRPSKKNGRVSKTPGGFPKTPGEFSKTHETPVAEAAAEAEAEANEETSLTGSQEAAPSSPDAAARLPGDPLRGSGQGSNFKRWDAETFRNSVRAEVEKDPGFAPIEAPFCDWWLESDPKGRPRFRLEKTWSTAGRLRSWLRRDEERRCFRAGRTSASAGADRNAIGGLARNCLAGLPASETFRPRHAFLDTPPAGPKWSEDEINQGVKIEDLF